MTTANGEPKDAARRVLLYHFCRMQLPTVVLSQHVLEKNLVRTYDLFCSKTTESIAWGSYLDDLYPLDWYVAVACLEGNRTAWDVLFAARASRADCLLVDALRARAARLYPGNEERQDGAVTEFWSQMLVSEHAESLPILARYDGQRPLVPWLIRVFQNWHISQLRRQSHQQALPEDDLPLASADNGDHQWHEAFRLAARAWLGQLGEGELLILGLRMRYRQSQREVARILKVHEGTISRQTTQLRDRCLEQIGSSLVTQGWSGDDLAAFVLNEMGSLLMDDPRLSADHLAKLLAQRGQPLPNPA